MKPDGEYGKAYYHYPFENDENLMDYDDLYNAGVNFQNHKYGLSVDISHENGYAGFTSNTGYTLYTAPQAPLKWDA